MRKLALALLVTGLLASCGAVPVGPVDMSCHANTGHSDAYGCSHGRG
jgi:hypothetical protein